MNSVFEADQKKLAQASNLFLRIANQRKLPFRLVKQKMPLYIKVKNTKELAHYIPKEVSYNIFK